MDEISCLRGIRASSSPPRLSCELHARYHICWLFSLAFRLRAMVIFGAIVFGHFISMLYTCIY
ncbi:hypothetical protein B0H16DRAFT_1692616 [Mycena metata]|uniref:Uncharacterized protein n=1 Tax=Mycena metata TaxID=1033252 RepID=A0AAD7IQ69_9AGAR|nr:hypothetical protein B0H16DRAFT_1692616 [Mycena metata]